VKFIVAAAFATSATVLAATPALAGPSLHTRAASIAPSAAAGAAGAVSIVTGTGLTEGQLLPQYPQVRPVFADGVTVSTAEVLVNGVLAETFTAPVPADLRFSWPDPVKLHGTDAVVTIRASGTDGSLGEASTRVRVDILAPQATLTPADRAIVSGVVPLQVASRHPDVARVEVRAWGGRIVGTADRAPWIVNWNTAGLNGSTFLMVNVYDHAGNAWPLGRDYEVDNAGPSVKSITPAHGSLVRGAVRTSISASDPSGIASASVRGGRATASPYTWTAKPTAQGPFTVEWTVTDKLGHRTVARRTVINDTVKPAVRVTRAPKKGAKLTKSVTVTAAAADRYGVARVQLLVNGKVVATDTKAAYAFTLNPKRYGKKFTVQIRAYDRAGNVTTTTRVTYRR
jgi:hypothetical protein